MLPSATTHVVCQGCRNIGRSGEGGAIKKLRAVETYEKQNNFCQLCLLLLNNNVALKMIKETLENAFRFDLDKP